VDHISTFGGAAGDQPVVADYDGDGRADRAIYNDGVWTVDLGFNSTLDSTHYLGGEPNDLAIAGTSFLALGMTGAIFLIADVLFDVRAAAVVSALFALVFAVLWYVWPTVTRIRKGEPT